MNVAQLRNGFAGAAIDKADARSLQGSRWVGPKRLAPKTDLDKALERDAKEITGNRDRFTLADVRIALESVGVIHPVLPQKYRAIPPDGQALLRRWREQEGSRPTVFTTLANGMSVAG